MKHLDLFSGIGGFSLAADAVWPDVEHIFCEINPFCRAILSKHWPHAPIHEDITKLAAPTDISLLTGGFPCQPFSQTGLRKGTKDERHLWPHMFRIIDTCRPQWIVGENVRGLLDIQGGLVFEQVCTDLESIGYEVQPFIIPACGVNAPHRRDRVWIVAHANHHPNGQPLGTILEAPSRPQGGDGAHHISAGVPGGTVESSFADADAGRLQRHQRTGIKKGTVARGRRAWDEDWHRVATRLHGLDDGVSPGVVRPIGWRRAALKACGNAIVPQIAVEIFKAIQRYES